MNTEQLETFLALAETKNFSRCAQRLIISQSAVSKRIFELEKELGQTLFHRSGGVALTGEGRAFRPYAEHAPEGMGHEPRTLYGGCRFCQRSDPQ